MNLTSEQIQAIRDGEPVPIVPPEVGEECVLVRRDVFEQARHAMEDDMLSPRTISKLVQAISDDEDDDYLEYYQQFKR
jgi:hypothetical protein